MIKIVLTVVAVVLLGVGAYYAISSNKNNSVPEQGMDQTQTTEPESDNSQTAQEVQSEPSNGAFISYDEYIANKAIYDDKAAVYFFAAKWCPTCQALTSDINANLSEIPGDVVIVNVDYDSNIDLRRLYGVTIQHTLVKVNADREPLDKWTGGNTLDTILGRI